MTATQANDAPLALASFYAFAPLAGYRELRDPLRECAVAAGLLGTVLLAAEGVNGSVAGPPGGVDALLAALGRAIAPARLRVSRTQVAEPPFHRLKIRLKREIVSLGRPQADPLRARARHVAPADFDALLADPQVTVVDVRNTYEHRIGAFDGALRPQTASFRDFPAWAAEHLDPHREQRLALYCTGGIRCEKASAWLLERGFGDVAQLDGGILAYLAQTPRATSRWRGECFVFDERVALDADLAAGSHVLCRACREPLSAEDCASPAYRPGVSCPYCHTRADGARRARHAERHRQAVLAERRGQRHVGARMTRKPRAKR